MPKINQEEYEVLKEHYDMGGEWIARDANGLLYYHSRRPNKLEHSSDNVWDSNSFPMGTIGDGKKLFHFVKWTDSEPYNIAELIKEYENEGKVMKKDIEWLKKEIEVVLYRANLRGTLPVAEGNLIYDDIVSQINQLDEPEVLSQEWIDEHSDGPSRCQYVWVDYLKELLVPKQELPVIPQNVADWITRFRDSLDLYQALKRLENSPTQVYKWYTMNNHKFVNAYLTGKYEVEEEPLYFALIKGHELMDDDGDMACNHWNLSIPDGRVFPGDRFSRHNEYLTKMSEEEWSKIGINESNAEFRKVGEVE